MLYANGWGGLMQSLQLQAPLNTAQINAALLPKAQFAPVGCKQ